MNIGESTSRKIIEKRIIRKSSSELRLPHVTMGINKARGDNFVGAVNDFRIAIGAYARLDLGNHVALNKDIRFGWLDIVIFVVDKHYTTFQQQRRGHCECF
jgi:hypothetical protein